MADYSGYRRVTLPARFFFAPCFDPLSLCIKHGVRAGLGGARKAFRIRQPDFAAHNSASFCTPVPQAAWSGMALQKQYGSLLFLPYFWPKAKDFMPKHTESGLISWQARTPAGIAR
jgi:hypothetical protein